MLRMITCLCLCFFVNVSGLRAEEPWNQPLNHFSLDLSRALFKQSDQGQNIVSPLGIWLALDVARQGAAGETRQQLETFLRLSAKQAREPGTRLADLQSFSIPRYFLGIEAKNNNGYGLLVNRVVAGSPAEIAGVRPGDLLLKIGQSPIPTERAYNQVMDNVGAVIELTFYQHATGELLSRKVTLKALETEEIPGIRAAGSLWTHPGFVLKPEFRKTAQSVPLLELLPFSENSESTAVDINRWVSRQLKTDYEAVTPQQLEEEVKFVVINVLTFQGLWAEIFDKAATKPRPFHLATGRTVEMPMMHSRRNCAYSTAVGWKCLALDFQGGQLQALFFLKDSPQSEQKSEQEILPSVEDYVRLTSLLKSTEVDVLLPVLEISSRYEQLEQFLPQQGLKLPFDRSQADFSGMSENAAVYISKMFQMASFAMDEAGAKATAVTVAIARPRSLRPDSAPEFHADRPFAFLIRDQQTGMIIFAGNVSKPVAKP